MTFVGAVFVTVAISAGYLWRTGELRSFHSLLSAQQSEAFLFNSPLRNRVRQNLLVAQLRQPEVVVIGSSRSLQFRAYAFTSSFANTGGGIQNIQHAPAIVRLLMRTENPPKVVLFPLDFWWFKQHRERNLVSESAVLAESWDLMSPVRFMLDGHIGADEFVRTVMGQSPISGFPLTTVGLSASRTGDGFGPDGSLYSVGSFYWYGRPASGASGHFATLKQRIVDGRLLGSGATFAHKMILDTTAIELFSQVSTIVAEHGAVLIPFLAPLPPSIYAEMKMRWKDHNYIDVLDAELSIRSDHYVNLLNGADIHSGDCEFLDGTHGGEVTQLRVLMRLAQDLGNQLSTHLDVAEIHSVIAQYEGDVIVPRAPVTAAMQGRPRLDFPYEYCREAS